MADMSDVIDTFHAARYSKLSLLHIISPLLDPGALFHCCDCCCVPLELVLVLELLVACPDSSNAASAKTIKGKLRNMGEST